jgi:hypothetical protein
MRTLEELKFDCRLGDLYFDYRSMTMVNPKSKILTRDTTKGVIQKVVFHCTDADGWKPERLSQFFVTERRFPVCAYHYYVMDQKVYHMVGENIITYHAAPYNSNGVAFSIDYFPSRDEASNIKIHPDVYENGLRTATFLCLKFKVLPIEGCLVGHRELFGTGWLKSKTGDHILRKTCPGLAINLYSFRQEVTRRCQEILGLTVDGIVGPKTKQAFLQLPVY